MSRVADALPDFPWDVLAPFAQRAREHPQGAVDLSVGTPVDPTPEAFQRALVASANAPGYPTTIGREDLRVAACGWLARQHQVSVSPSGIIPTIGSKELVASLPRLLGLAAGDRIAIPRIAYPTYAVGAVLAGCEYVATDEPESVEGARLVWLNSPSNPTGAVLSPERLAQIVAWGRENDVVVVSDECYIDLGWESQPTSVLHPSVSGGDHTGILSLFSLSKRSNMAGYRLGLLAGDPKLVGDVLEVRKHSGMMVPAPVQAAAIAAFDDEDHVAIQRERYRRRREVLRGALVAAGFSIEHSEAGLYLWATRGEPCWDTVAWFADRGIVVTPGDFYGPAGRQHIRMALTGTDEQVDSVPGRLAGE